MIIAPAIISMANEATSHIVFGISNKIPAINSAIPIPILPKGLSLQFQKYKHYQDVL
jgi:hypothetical protein